MDLAHPMPLPGDLRSRAEMVPANVRVSLKMRAGWFVSALAELHYSGAFGHACLRRFEGPWTLPCEGRLTARHGALPWS